jgi:glycosyltransferase involved in cell wall biosynthesis
MLFYSDWPLGYHNKEAERKAVAFARRGYDAVYVAGVGTRNPRISSAGKAVDRLTRKVRERGGPAGPGLPEGLRAASLLVAPPRQVPAVRRANARWVERQLRGAIGDWDRAVAWVRHATPELVDALSRLRPGAIVYECVDAHHEGPGMTGIWRELFEDAERALAQTADRVVVTSPALAPRFEAWGADVRFVPHGVDLFPWQPPRERTGSDAVLGFVGYLDHRLDLGIVRHVALARPQWRIRLVGPARADFDPAPVADLPNVSIEPPVAHERVGEVLAELDLGLLAYGESPIYRHMAPLKNLELLAAGRPVVVRPNAALEPYAGVVRFASTAEEFLAQADRALAEDGPDAARERRAVAEGRSWERTIDELDALVAEVLAERAERPG